MIRSVKARSEVTRPVKARSDMTRSVKARSEMIRPVKARSEMARPVKARLDMTQPVKGKVRHDLDQRSYQNVKFFGFSIYEVKSGGLSLKKIDLTFK